LGSGRGREKERARELYGFSLNSLTNSQRLHEASIYSLSVTYPLSNLDLTPKKPRRYLLDLDSPFLS
jgi:hypothetical protein